MHCLWCDQSFQPPLSWRQLFGLKEQELLCEKCRQSMTFISGEICRVCGRMLELTPPEFVEGDVCVDCLRWEKIEDWRLFPFQNRSLFIDDEPMKEFIARFKFRGDAKLIEAIQPAWQAFWEKECNDELIVPIPLSSERSYERGFNQSLLLAAMLPGKMDDLLLRPLHFEKQSKKTRRERVHSTGSIFMMKEEKNVIDKSVVIIDDIYTTGTTVRHAARVLYEHGAKKVTSLTLARGI